MIYIFFIGLWLCLIFTPQKALLDDTLQMKEVESDDDKLNQALILVDILKTEYVKLLRQNILLRSGDDTVIDDVEQPTCAPNATETPGAPTETNVNQTSILSMPWQESADLRKSELSTDGSAPLPPARPPAPAQATPFGPNMTTPVMTYYNVPVPTQLPYPLYQKHLQAPRRYFRRRIPDYYYYDIPRRRVYNEPPVVGPGFRRFDYDNDPFNDTPTTVLTTPTVSTTTVSSTTAASNTAATASQVTTSNTQGSPDTTTVLATPAQPVETTSATKTNPLAPSSGKPTMRASTVTRARSVRPTASTSTLTAELDHEQLKEKVHHTPSLLTTKDPVDTEVALELVKELKEEGIPLKKLKGTSSTNPTIDIFDPAFKTSMRIFLEKSTRYPIPLPENHAFCYTNPNNPLCRTLIR